MQVAPLHRFKQQLRALVAGSAGMWRSQWAGDTDAIVANHGRGIAQEPLDLRTFARFGTQDHLRRKRR